MLERERMTQDLAQKRGAPIPGILKPLSMFISFAEEFFSTEEELTCQHFRFR